MPITRRRQSRVLPGVAPTPEERKAGARTALATAGYDLERTYGEEAVAWKATRRAALRVLRTIAHDRRGETIAYSDLNGQLVKDGYLGFDVHSQKFADFLGQINLLEMLEGDPMITAVVVMKHGSRTPGVGFWNIADDAGLFHERTDEEKQDVFWLAELYACHDVWSRRSPSSY
ncbi:MAG TPA: hypothetical protein VHS27_10370 [Gaiellales bacterium]|jgi:hypothetical protein|nr:hypothetical protein [Gaiellales bacterium]